MIVLRDYKAVARSDLDTLTSTLKAQLTQQVLQAFVLQSDEALHITTCHYAESADHGIGDEAKTVTMKATDTCKGVAYNQNELETKGAAQYAQQTRPGTHYQLIGSVSIHLESITPVTVMCSGYWVYTLSQKDRQYLAQEIAGDAPAKAKAFLLKTGYITQATVTETLPAAAYIHFEILIS